MAWIRQIAPEEAEGPLREFYDAAVKRAGRVFNILRVQSLRLPTLKSSVDLYLAAMFGRSPLSRAQREMLAVVVSAVNRCVY
jgi:alkylhydroperoxidase family enzyme